MKLLPFVILAFLCLINLAACDNDEKEPVDPCVSSNSVNGAIVVDRYIVTVPTEGENSGGRQMVRGLGLLKRHNLSEQRIVKHFEGNVSYYVLNLSSSEAAKLKADQDVLRMEPDKIVSICACFEVVEPSLVTWNVDKVGYGDGTGKTAWILDSGVDLDHPDLNVDKSRSKSFITDSPTADDDNGHGTHIAGIIGAKNNSIGTLGVASGATIVALKVLDVDGNGNVSYILDALDYIRDHGHPGDVVNLSLEVDNDFSVILDEEVQSLANAGYYICIAAGNNKVDASSISPARANGKNIYTVSAVDSLDKFASWSNFGNDAVDFAAPGVRILSSYMEGKYAIISGTSQAAPHVAGILLINGGKVNSLGNALNDPDGIPDPLAHK